MTRFFQPLHRFIGTAILPLLAMPLPVSGAALQNAKAKATSAARSPTGPSTGIIDLPLNPVVPAARRQCAARTPSGLGYTMLRAGSGARPGAADLVLVNYIGYLAASGVVFDQGMRSALSVDGVIPGFSQGVQMLARTGIARFCIPAALGYGAQASGPIPANSDLVFQVELLDFKAAEPATGMSTPGAAEPATPKDPAPQP